MKLPKFLNRFSENSGDPETDTLWTTPWAWRDDSGLYVGTNGQFWLYRSYPLSPISPAFEDPATRLASGQGLEQALRELGDTSKEGLPGLGSSTSDYREVHIVALSWDTLATPPEGTPEKLDAYMKETFGFLVPQKTLLIGVRLRSRVDSAKTAVEGLKGFFTTALGEDVPDVGKVQQDQNLVESILARAGCRKPTEEERRHLEGWYNLGRGTDALISEKRDHLVVDSGNLIELAAVMGFNRTVNYAPNFQWAQNAEVHDNGARIVSVRGELEPATSARKRLRQSQRRIRSQIQEEQETGDIEKVEYSDTFELASAVEDHFVNSQEPLLTRCSIVMARRVEEVQETYLDYLRNYLDIEVRPLDMRQLPALDETLPCSSKRVNPFVQELSLSMIAYAGLNGFSALGDRRGVYTGLASPNFTTTFLDPTAAPAENKPPSLAIFGDPGSGKTFLAQLIAYQSSLSGLPVIFINPKEGDTLSPLAKLANGRIVSMSRLEKEGGAFDPFRYAPTPEIAAQLLASHILSVMTGFTEQQELTLSHGLRNAAMAGARCAKEALAGVSDREIVTLVAKQVQTSPTFALGFGLFPQERLDADRRLTLIEFDRKLNFPDPSKDARAHTRDERIALAAVSLVVRASIEILGRSRGGVLVVDEAWKFLSHPAGQAAMQQLGREGRSLNVLPVFCTQKVADLLGSDMESYLSRVFVMALQEEREASAALRLCGLEPTASRLEWLANAGPQPEDEERPARWATALHRDLHNRHAAVLVGPVPEKVRQAFTTNPAERERIRRQLAVDQGEEQTTVL